MCQGLERNRKLFENKKKMGELDSDSDEEEKEKYRCPGCQVLDRKIMEVLDNFNKKIGRCKSEHCKGKYYCFQCKENFEVANESDGNLLFAHFQNNECHKEQQPKEENNNDGYIVFFKKKLISLFQNLQI